MQALIYEPSYRRIADRLDQLISPDRIALFTSNGELQRAKLGEGEAVFGWSNVDLFNTPNARSYLQALLQYDSLRWIQSSAAGLDNPLLAQALHRGVRLTTNHSQAIGMAEFILGVVMDQFQAGAWRRAAQADRAWRPTEFREVRGSNWLFVGFGAIGQETAKLVRALGGNVTGVRRSAGSHPLADKIVALSDVVAELPSADVVVLCIAPSGATQRIANRDFFRSMRSNALIVNVGRGALLDEQALIEALDANQIGHAVLDVFDTEPLPPDHPLWSHPRISVSPHMSPKSDKLVERGDELFLENVRRFLANQPLLNEETVASLPDALRSPTL